MGDPQSNSKLDFPLGLSIAAILSILLACLISGPKYLPCPSQRQFHATQQDGSQKAETDQATLQCDDKAPDWWMVRLTALVILVSAAQLWMFYRQWRVMHHGLGDTRAAAEAALTNARAAQIQADIAERALSNLEQPHIFVPDIDWIEKTKTGYIIRFAVANYGRSPAIIREIQTALYLRTTPPDIKNPIEGKYISSRIFEALSQTQAKDDRLKYSYPVPKDVAVIEHTDEDGNVRYVPITAKGEWAYFVVRVLYDDVFNSANASSFVWRYNKRKMIFIRPAESSYSRIKNPSFYVSKEVADEDAARKPVEMTTEQALPGLESDDKSNASA